MLSRRTALRRKPIALSEIKIKCKELGIDSMVYRPIISGGLLKPVRPLRIECDSFPDSILPYCRNHINREYRFYSSTLIDTFDLSSVAMREYRKCFHHYLTGAMPLQTYHQYHIICDAHKTLRELSEQRIIV